MFEEDFSGVLIGFMSEALAEHFETTPFGGLGGQQTTYGKLEALVTAVISGRSWAVLSGTNDNPAQLIIDREPYAISLTHSEGGFDFFLIPDFSGFADDGEYTWNVPALIFATTPESPQSTFNVAPSGG